MPSMLRAGLIALLVTLAAPAAAVAQSTAQASAAPASAYLTVAQLRRRYGDAQSRYMTISGLEIHYKDEGPRDAPVLLMIHGSQSSLRTWDRIVAIMQRHYRIVRFDVPGYGLSGRISDAASTVPPVDVPETLLTRLGIAKIAAAVGVSSGGTMGMYLAAKRPDMVERLILSNTPSDPVDTSHLVMPDAFLKAQARARTTGMSDLDFWNQYLSYFSGDPARISSRTRGEYYDFNRRVPEKYPIALVARIGDGKQATIEMAKVRAPTFLVWGGADPLLPEAAVVAISRYLKNAPLSKIVMPDVGHYPPLEVPDRFARWIAAYVEAGTPYLDHSAKP